MEKEEALKILREDYVSFETAKLLKEKGFDEPCYAYWNEDENRLIVSQSMYAIRNITNPCFFGSAVPTLQMAMKWLREVHNFHIWVEPNHDKEGLYNAHVKIGWWSNNWAGIGYNTHEKACEAAIKYCLENLI